MTEKRAASLRAKARWFAARESYQKAKRTFKVSWLFFLPVPV